MFSSGLKYLGSRQFRLLAKRFVSSRLRAIAFGLGSGALIQSTSAALVILASLIRTGLVTVQQAITVLTGFSVGNCLLIFIVSFNISAALSFVVGLCGITMYLTKDEKLRTYFVTVIGLGLIFFGIEIMVSGVKPLKYETWFVDIIAFACHHSILSIMAGILLGFIAQSSTAVALVAVGLAKEGILLGSQTFLFMYGAAIGSTLFKVLLGQAFAGTSKQLVKFVNLFNFFGAAVFILLYYIETYLQVPLVMALLNAFHITLEHQAAWVFLLFNVTSAVFFMAINGLLVRWLERTIPPSEQEDLAKPKYIREFKAFESESTLDLIRLEQRRELEQIVAIVPSIGRQYTGLSMEFRQEALHSLSQEVISVLKEVGAMQMNQQTADRFTYLHTRQTILDQLSDACIMGLKRIVQSRAIASLEMLSDACMESVDFLLSLAVEADSANDADQTGTLLTLSSASGPAMEQLRERYMNGYGIKSTEDKACLLDLVMETEKIIWLVNKLFSIKVPDEDKDK